MRVATPWKITLGVMLATSLFLGALALGWLRLEVPHQHWFAHGPFSWGTLMAVPIASVLGLAATLCWCLARNPRKRAHWLVMAAFLCALGGAVFTRASGHGGFVFGVAIVVCDGSNSYYATAAETADLLALTRNYPALMPRLRFHCQTQSPGATLLHAVLRRAFLSSPPAQWLGESLLALTPGCEPAVAAEVLNHEWNLKLSGPDITGALLVGVFFAFVGALGTLPVYALARRVAGVRPAVVVTALYAVTPSLMWFSPAVDQAYPTLATCIALLLHTAWRRHRRLWLLVPAGLLTGLGMFLSLGFAMVAVISALMLLFQGLTQRGLTTQWARESALRLALFGGAVLAVLVAIRLGFGLNLVTVWRVSTSIYLGQYKNIMMRPWLTWVLLNPVEYAIGLGLSSLALIAGAVALLRRLRPSGAVILSAVLLALVMLDLSGRMRAEGSRLLIFTMPLVLIGAAPVLRRFQLTRGLAPCLLVAAQGLYAVIGYQLFEVWGVWATAFR